MKEKLKCGLLGKTLGHSYSKQIHSVFADYAYELCEASEERAIEIIKSGEFDGLNVTIPYKELAYSLCNELDEVAHISGCVNTVFYRHGKIFGANTDVYGFISMVQSAGISFMGKHILILGSGGTSKTAQLAASIMGAEKVTVVSRKGEVNYSNVYEQTDANVIVNTTPVGMYPKNGESPIDLLRFPDCSGVVDVVYNPAKTRLMFEAERLGIPCVSGLYMLAAQGYRAAQIFADKKIDVALIDEAVKSVSRSVMNVVLIGMPGAGKSAVAKKVAALLGREVIDTDEVIRKRHGAPSDIILKQGEDAFREIEAEVCAEVGRERGLVISTGGGVVEREENWRHLSQNGRIYLIEREISRLATHDRPLSSDVEALYERRRDKYNSFADVKIDNNGKIDQAAEEIVKDFKE